ncbi:M48 family metallopeptidase [Desulfosporosinus youngiae]|uniref:Putative metal-dependent hydrolase n=1 Tax=Desulfosporosinus youngiae DSM 17734 TaxID=768710 RepID=H5XTH6_9FIRM|nr:SprT family zinc-dependent metalloprotease [Desulfosporosinus youngiae]EHQ88575.1 putative metal-dependent hydrolase [Desulfosporosinus youngiae DSM 17734]
MDQLCIRDQMIPYEERRSARYRRVTLTILEDRLRITAPKNVSAKQLKELLLTKQEWILKSWLKNQDRQKPPAEYHDGQQFLYQGENLELRIQRHKRKMLRVSPEGQVLRVYIPEDLPVQAWVPNIQAALISWYKDQARKVLQDKLDKQAKRMEVTFQTFRLKAQKTRWGSCSSKRNINLNWRIIMAPDEVIDYVIIHELAHLTYLNHSVQFWERVAQFMPEYKQWRKWLKDHGQKLSV